MRIIYYAIFHSMIFYGIITWGGAYNNKLGLLQSIQSNILKCVNKNTFEIEKMPCNLRQLFTFESLQYYYELLKENFLESNRVTRNKSIKLPGTKKAVSNKMSSTEAIKTFNSLPNELKTLQVNRKATKQTLKKWIQQNI